MQLPRQSTRPRDYLAILAALTVTIVITVLWYPSLPDPIASHWGFNGDPDGFMPKAVDAWLMPLLVLSSVVLVWAAGRADRAAAQMMVGAGNGLAVFFAGLRVVTYVANRDVATWADAGRLTGWHLLWLFMLSTAIALLTGRGARYRPEHVVQVQAVSAEDVASAAATYDGYVTARVMVGLPVVMLALGLIMYAIVPPPVGGTMLAVFAVTGVLSALFTRARVTVTSERVTVGFGPFGFPAVTRTMASITDVNLLHVEPLTFGGWGYRVLPGVRAVVIRRGEGLRLTCIDKPDLVVTLDEAATAAAVVARHIRQVGSGM